MEDDMRHVTRGEKAKDRALVMAARGKKRKASKRLKSRKGSARK